MPHGYVAIEAGNACTIYFCSMQGAETVVASHPDAQTYVYREDLQGSMSTSRPAVEDAATARTIAAARSAAAALDAAVRSGRFVAVVVNCREGRQRTPLVAALYLRLRGVATTVADLVALVRDIWADRLDAQLDEDYVRAYLQFMEDTRAW